MWWHELDILTNGKMRLVCGTKNISRRSQLKEGWIGWSIGTMDKNGKKAVVDPSTNGKLNLISRNKNNSSWSHQTEAKSVNRSSININGTKMVKAVVDPLPFGEMHFISRTKQNISDVEVVR